MATPSTQTLAVSCPDCGARFRLGVELAGKKGRCAKCGSVFRVPAASRPVGGLSEADSAMAKRTESASETPPTRNVTPPTRKDSESVPQYIRVYCRVCQTMMYGRPDEVGHAIKCPDCGAQTIVPQPEQVQPKKQPAAIADDDELELWGVDEAPSVAEMLAAQPHYIAVECRLCQTLMQATEDQVGKPLKCPDCGTSNVVQPPARAQPTRSVLARDEDDILIDPTLDPGERAPVLIPPRRPMLYEEEAEAERKRQEEKAARGDRSGPQYDRTGRPVMPRWPLATRILPFLFSPGVPVRWIIFSIGAFCGLGIRLYGLSIAMMGGFAAIGGMCFVAMGIMIMMMWFAGFSATVFAIVTESSEGNDSIERWPSTVFSEWFGEMFTLLVALLVSPLLGWLAGRVVVDDPMARNALFLGSVVVCLPIVMLSQLDVGSMFGVASPRVIASVLRLPGSWLLFYIEIAAIVAVCVGMTIAAERIPYLGLVLIPLYVAAMILAARILGRLAWKLAESTEQGAGSEE